jgi:hypothetical protein
MQFRVLGPLQVVAGDGGEPGVEWAFGAPRIGLRSQEARRVVGRQLRPPDSAIPRARVGFATCVHAPLFHCKITVPAHGEGYDTSRK